MAQRLLAIALLGLAGCAIAAQAVDAKGLEGPRMHGASGGVTVGGSDSRYITVSPGFSGDPKSFASPDFLGKLTVVAQVDRDGGRLGRWWYLRGRGYYVPEVAYDGTPGGLSANGGVLVLENQFSPRYPPKRTKFAILDTRLFLRHPLRPDQDRPHHAITHVNLRGSFGFDAISPGGSTVYLIHYLSPRHPAAYEVRALDTPSGRLLPEPIVDPDEPEEQMEGLPITRATSLDGRWAYTLYDGNGKQPFIHALDTVGQRAVCIDLPQLAGRDHLFMLRLHWQRGGRGLAVLSRPAGLGGSRQLLSVDTRTFEVKSPNPTAIASSGISPWPPIGLAVGALLLVLCWKLWRQRDVDNPPPVEP